MPDEGYESRTVTTLRTGSKIALLCGLPLLGLAVYFYFVPLMVQGQNGVFGCGSASSPPTSDWAKGVCQGVPDAAKYRAILAAVLGVLIPALGLALFGVDKRQERRAVRPHPEDEDDFDDAPVRRSARRRGADDDDEMSPSPRGARRSLGDEGARGRSRGRDGSDESDDDGPLRYQPAPRVDR